jgi:2-polyprenyl-3-methyl-5-hydroxy-6-metoxy-1,4-benzoquinol methylase
MWRPGLPATINWQTCDKCGHTYTDGYFEGEALDFLLERGQSDQFPRVDENARVIASRLIDNVVAPHEPFDSLSPRWLDVGFGAGALVMTAAEYGYDVMGLDLRQANVDAMHKLGYPAITETIEDHEESTGPAETYNVISMMDVLEHMPFPKTALDAAYKLLRFDGALIVSCPNMDTAVWRAMDKANGNPYWSEIEHYHNFTRKSLSALLDAHGFSPVSYHVSQRYISCCEIIAMKKDGSL